MKCLAGLKGENGKEVAQRAETRARDGEGRPWDGMVQSAGVKLTSW